MRTLRQLYQDLGLAFYAICVVLIVSAGVIASKVAAQTPPKLAPPQPVRSQLLTLTQRLQYQVLYLQICGEAEIKPSACSIDWSRGTVSEIPAPPATK